MADKQLQIKISATDAASAVFRKLGGEANAAAKQIDTGAKQAGKSLDTLSDSAKKTEASTQSLERANALVGIGFAALGTSIGLYSRQIVENQQAVATLERTYGETAGQLQQFANSVQATTVYSSEQAVAAENIFGTLVRNYGLSVSQVQQLVTISTDLAATSGLTLADTATRVQAAIRGEAESAEALGLTLNQQAIDREGLTLTMSAQEAAQYRLNALMEQSAFAQGAASQQADTTAGKIKQLANSFDDAAKTAIGFTGPLPQIVSGLSSVGMETGLAVSGLVSLGKGFKEMIDAAGGIKNVITSSQGLTAALGTAGLVAASAAAFYGAQALARHFDSDFPAALHKAQETAVDLDAAIAQLTGTLANANIALRFTSIDSGLDQAQKDLERIAFLQEQVNTIPQGGRAPQATIDQYEAELSALEAQYGDTSQAAKDLAAAQDSLAAILTHSSAGADEARQQALNLSAQFNTGAITLADYRAGLDQIIGSYDTLDQAALQVTASNQRVASSFADVTKAIASVVASDAPKSLSDTALALQSTTVQVLDSIQYFTNLGDAFWGLSGGAKAYADVQADVNNILANGTEAQLQELAMLEAMHRTHQISADTFAVMVDDLNNSVQESAAANALAEASQKRLNAAMDAGEASARKSAAGVSELSETSQRGTATLITFRDVVDSNAETANRAAGAFGHMAEAISHVGKFAELDLGLAQTVTRSYDAWRGETQTLAISHDKLNDSLAGGTDELAAYIDAANKAAQSIGLLSTNAQLFQAAGIKAPSLDVAVNLQTGQGAFDAVFGAIKQAQSLSSSIGGAKSWADELIGDPGTWSELDKLLAEGRINVDQYNAAQAAQVSISKDVTNAQRDLLAVQVNMAPALADVTRKQAEYIDGLQDLSAEQQIAALGFMDNAESAKAMQLAQLAAASSTDTMQASTSAMITEMANADPVLKQMLLQMGLISEGADGTITVNYDEANSANDAMNELTKSIDALIVALGGIPPIHTESNATDTQKDVDGLTDSLNNVPRNVASTLTAIDNATNTIADVKNSLLNLDGQTATTYVDTVYRTQLSDSLLTGMTGTTVSAMATGGTMTADIPRYAIGGTHGGSHALVGEAGPEMVWLPNGAQVTNAVATRSKRESIEARRGGDINIYGPMTLNPAGSDAYAAIQQEMMGGTRR